LEEKYQNSRAEQDRKLSELVIADAMHAYRQAVNNEGKEIAKEATDAYRDLAQYLLVKYMDGNMKKTDENGNFIKSEHGLPVYPSFPGYDKKYYENIVKETGDHFLIPSKEEKK
ncbi:MAG: dipeptidase, partial [Muribaculaceae bacterium]|nr:dipeptidase [Muribaculaceae bacterium]